MSLDDLTETNSDLFAVDTTIFVEVVQTVIGKLKIW